MVDRIATAVCLAADKKEHKINVVDNPCRGHTLTEPSHSHLVSAEFSTIESSFLRKAVCAPGRWCEL